MYLVTFQQCLEHPVLTPVTFLLNILKFSTLQSSISSCDRCHWQQYMTACSRVQTPPAPRDSAPQAVNRSSGRLCCFYEKFSGRHKEKSVCVSAGGLELPTHTVYTSGAENTTRTQATRTLETAREKVNDALTTETIWGGLRSPLWRLFSVFTKNLCWI